MFPRAGGTKCHARILKDTLLVIDRQLRGGQCEALGSDLRLYSKTHQVYAYPDIVITCGPDNFLDEREDTILDATAIVEILSPSTRNYDRGEKFRIYRSLPSFSEYLLLAQDEVRADHHVRQPDGSWLFRELSASADIIELSSIGCRLPLHELYERADFEPPKSW